MHCMNSFGSAPPELFSHSLSSRHQTPTGWWRRQSISMSRMETYPASLSLGEESAQMWSLNQRLEAYLTRVKALEEENELLRAEILHLQSTRSDKSLIRKYHDEMMKLRVALDDGHQEMVQVETDRDVIYQEIEYVKELCHQEKRAQEDVKKELSESKKLLEEEKRVQVWLKERLLQLQEEMEDILKAHEEDKAEMEEEISSYSQRLENFKIAPANFQPVDLEDYAQRLSQIWQGAVAEYKSEVSALETNLSQAKENLKKVLEENRQSQLQLQNLDRDLQSLRSRKEMLEKLLGQQWLEQQEEEGRLQLEVETLEKEKRDLRVQITHVLEDRQQLMHLKMSLSLEVATYRSLLEAESTRLYTPSTDYRVSSPFHDSMLEQDTFRKSRQENTRTPVSKDHRLNANKKQSPETSSANRYLNVKSTSFSNRASPVTKEFQKVSSVLQSQGLNYTKASSAKAATKLPPVERNLERHQNGDVVKKSKVEMVSHSYSQDSSKTVSKETVRKDTDIRPVLNGSDYDTTDAGFITTGRVVYAKGKLLPPPEKEAVTAQVECSLKPTRKHVQFISNFGLEDKQYFLEAEHIDIDTLVFEKPQKGKIDFQVQQDNDEDFGHTDEEHTIGKQEVIGQILSSQRVYGTKEELVEPLDYQNTETSIEVNNEELRHFLDFSKPKTQDIDEPNVLSPDNVSEQGIECSLSQGLDFDTQVSLSNADVDKGSHDKEDINQGLNEEKESLQLNGGLELSRTEETSNYVEATVDLQDEEVTMDQKFQVLSSLKEDSNQLFDDEQNFVKDIYDGHKSEMEDYNENPEKDTTEVPKDTNIQEYNDNALDQQSSRQDEDILDGPHSLDIKSEVNQWSDDQLENTQCDQERQKVVESCEAPESRSHPLNEKDFKIESIKEEDEGNKEENATDAEQNTHDSTDIEKSGIIVVREVYQSNKKALEDLEEIQFQSQEEKNNFEVSDLQQSSPSSEDQIVKAPEEITQEFSDSNQAESEDQKNQDLFDQVDNVQEEVSQLSEDVLEGPHSGLEDLKSVDLSYAKQEGQQIDEDHIENEQIGHTLDFEEGDSSQDIHPEKLHDHVQEESPITNEEGEDIQKSEKEIKQSDREGQIVQSTPEHEIQSSVGEELEKDVPSLENDLIEKEEDLKTSMDDLKNSEVKADEEDKEDVSEENDEVCTAVQYTKSVRTEIIAQYIHGECESHEEDNDTEKAGPTQVEEEDSRIPEHGADKEQEQFVSTDKGNEEDTQLVQKESDVQLNIAKEDGSLLQKTEPIVEGQSEVSRDMDWDCAKVDDVHQDSDVKEGQPSNKETSFQHESEDLIQSDGEKDHEESTKLVLPTEEHTLSKEGETNQFTEQDSEIVEEAKASTTQESPLLDTETNGNLDEVTEKEQEEKSSFHQEEEGQKSCGQEVEGQEGYHLEVEEEPKAYHQKVEEVKEDNHQEVEEVKEGYNQEVEVKEAYHQEVEEVKEVYHQEVEEVKEGYNQEVEVKEVYHQEVEEVKESYNQEVEVKEGSHQEVEEVKESYNQEVEVKEGYHHKEEDVKEGYHQEVEEVKEGSHQEVEEVKESYNQEVEVKEGYHHKEEEVKEGSHQEVEEVKEGSHQEVEEVKEGSHQEVEEVKEGSHQEVEEVKEGYHHKEEDVKEGYHQEVEEVKEDNHQEEEEVKESYNQEVEVKEGYHQEVEEVKEGYHHKEEDVKEDYHQEAEEVKEDNHQEEEEVKESYHQEVEEVKEGSHHEEEDVKEGYHQEEEEVKEAYHQEVEEVKEGYHQEVEEVKEAYHQEVEEVKEGYHQEEEEVKEAYHQEVEEVKEGYHQEAEVRQEDFHQEVEVGNDISTINKNVASEDNKERDQSLQKDSDEEQCMEFSLNIIPNNLRFTSNNDAETQPERQEQICEFSDEGTEAHGDEVHVCEGKFEDNEQNNDIITEVKEVEEAEIISQQSTFHLEHVCEDLLLENSQSHVVFAENPTEKYDFDEKHLTELDIEAASNPDNDHSKSEDSMDSQDISIYSQKSEEFEISKDYQFEQTLPDTTPLPNLDDEFEDLADDEIILASEQSAVLTESQCPEDGGDAEEMLDSSLESQSSQILHEESEQSNIIKHDDKDPEYNEQQEESLKDLVSEHPEHFIEPKLDIEDSSVTLVTEEPAAEPSEHPVDSKTDDENTNNVAIFSPEVDEFEASKVKQLEKTHLESSPPEDQVQLSSEQLGSESVDDDHNEEPKERRVILIEDTNAENFLTDPTEYVPVSEHQSESNEQQEETPIDLVPEHPEHFIEPKLDKEDSSATLDTREDTESQTPADGEAEEVVDSSLESQSTQLPNLDDEFEDLADDEIILASEQSALLTKSQCPEDGGDAEEMLDSSLESQTSQILHEVSEQSSLIKPDEKESDSNEQQQESPSDLLVSEHPEHFVDPKLETEDSSVTLVTEEPAAEPSEDPVDSKTDDENTKSEQSTALEEVAIFSLEVDEFEASTVTQLEKTQLESSPPENQVQLSSEQLGSESVDDDHNEEPKERRVILIEDTNVENFLTEPSKYVPSSEHSETELVPSPSHEDTTESQSSQILPEVSEKSDSIQHNEKEPESNEQQEESPKDLVPEHPEHFVEPKLDKADSSASLDTREDTESQTPADGDAEEVLDSSLESQSSQILQEESEQSNLIGHDDKHPEYNEQQEESPSTTREEVNICSPEVDEFEASKDTQLEKTQLESSPPEDQVQLSSEQLGSESVDDDHNEEPKERRVILIEDTNAENFLTEPSKYVPSSEHSETELVPSPSHEDATESQSSQILHEGSEQSDLIQHDEKEPDSNEQQEESPKDLVPEHPEHFVEPKLDKEDSSATLDTREDTKSQTPADGEAEEVLESSLESQSTQLPNLDDEFEDLADDEIILASEQSAVLTKSQCPEDDGEAEEVLDSSLESQSSQILPEESEQSNLIENDDKDPDYKEQQEESPSDLLDGEHPEHCVEPKLDTEDSSVTLVTEEPAAELSEDPVDSKTDDESTKSEQSTAREEVNIFSPEVDEFEASKDIQLEKTQLESSPPENQVQLSSEQLGSESVDDDHNEELKEKKVILIEDTNAENLLTDPIGYVPASEHSETELIPSPSHEDTTESQSSQILHEESEKSDLIQHDEKEPESNEQQEESPSDLVPEHPEHFIEPKLDTDNSSATLDTREDTESQTPADGEAEEVLESSLESQSSQILQEESEQSNVIQHDDKDPEYNEQQEESPSVLLVSEHPGHFIEPKLDTEASSVTLVTEEPAAELSEDPVDSKTDDESTKSEQSTAREEVNIFSPEVDEFEASKDIQLEKTQFEPSPPEDQVQLSSEPLGSESVDDDHNEEPKERRVILIEDINADNLLTDPTGYVPVSEHSETELVPSPSHEDTTESQSSQILHEVSEQSNVIKHDEKEPESNEQQEESPSDFLESEDPEHCIDPKLNTEDSSATLDTREDTESQTPADGEAEEVLDSSLESQSTQLPNLDDEFEDLADDEIILASEQSAVLTKSQCPEDGGDAEEVLDSSLESQSSQILHEVSEQSSLIKHDEKESDSNEQQEESPIDLVPEHPEHFVEPKLDTEDSSVTLVTEEPAAEPSEDPVDSKTDDENTKSEQSTAREEVAIFSPEVDEFEASKVTQLESSPSEDQVQLSSEQLGSESVDDHNEEPKERRVILIEDTNAENFLTEPSKYVPSSEHSETELVPSPSHEDATESQSSQILHKGSEQSNVIKHDEKESDSTEQQEESPIDLVPEHPEHFVESKLDTDNSSVTLDTREDTEPQTPADGEAEEVLDSSLESQSSQILPEESEQSHLIEHDVKDQEYNEQQEESPSDLLVSEHPEHFIKPKLDTEDSSAILVTEEPAAEPSEDPVDSKTDDQSTKSEQSTIREDVAIFSLKVDEFEASKVTQLEKTQLESSPPEDQVQLSSEQLGSESVDDDHNEEPREKRVILIEDTNAENFLTDPTGYVPVSEHSETELVPSPSHEDTTESQSSQILHEVSEQSDLIQHDEKESDSNEQQQESPSDLVPEHPEHFVEPKLDTDNSSVTLDTREDTEPQTPADGEAEEVLDSSLESLSSQILQEESEQSHLIEHDDKDPDYKEQQEESPSVLLVSEHPEHCVEPKLDTEDSSVTLVTEEPAAELSEDPIDSKTDYENTKSEQSTVQKKVAIFSLEVDEFEASKVTQLEKTQFESSPPEDQVQLSSESVESETQNGITLGTSQGDVKVDEKPSEESSEKDDSITSDESSPNVSTISYALEQEDSRLQHFEKGDMFCYSGSMSPKELEQKDPLLTPEPVQEGGLMEQMEPQTSSDEERVILGERSDSSCDSNVEHEYMSTITREYIEDRKTVSETYGHTIVQATLELDDHMFNGNSTSEIFISDAKTVVRFDGDTVNSQSQDKIEDSVLEFTKSEGKSEGLFQSLLETSEHKEGRLDEASEMKTITQAAVKYVDSDDEPSHYPKKLINPYLSERDLEDPSEVTSLVMDEDLVNTKKVVSETNQGLNINKQEDSWSSDE